MQPTDNLKEEHRVIERMIRVINAVSGKLDRGEAIPSEVVEDIVDFIRTFADRCHHAKEEDLLYARAEARGIPKEGGPIGVMLMEHEQGRDYVRGIVDALPKYTHGDKNARTMIARNARAYGSLLSQHIMKEDNILYPMINDMLTGEDQCELMGKFEEVERERIGEERHHHYIHLVEKLERDYL